MDLEMEGRNGSLEYNFFPHIIEKDQKGSRGKNNLNIYTIAYLEIFQNYFRLNEK